MQNQIHLLSARRFMPLFVTQLLGAFNDNVFKNAMMILVLYRIADGDTQGGQMLVTLAGGLFILPFFLFSATAGQLADRYDKAMLIRRIKLTEVAVMALGAVAFAMGDPWFLIVVLFLMGTQSAFFGPLKYAILPDHLGEDELIGGNALIEMGTFLAILVGTILGGAIVLQPDGVTWICAIVVATALAGWGGSLMIPKAPAADPGLKIGLNPLTETWKILKDTAAQENVFLSILGISWFWLVGATYLTQLPAFTKDHLGANEQVLTLLLTVFSIGIGLGSLLCNRLLKGEINAKYVPFAAIGLSLFAVDLFFAASDLAPTRDELVGVAAFVRDPGNWRVLADLLLMAVCGGVFIVPLYAILQAWSDESARARAVAANNIMNALFVVGAAAATVVLLGWGATVPQIFLAIAVASGAVAVLAVQLLPHEVAKALAVRVLRLLYRVKVHGADNLEAAGKRAVIVVNHVSFLDGVLLAAFLPGRPTFAVNTEM
ncbi:MAG: MFS transporter, partial [Rhodobacterales bacterium]|nr:MFS transporter [Rhodobacterales bacterium]